MKLFYLALFLLLNGTAVFAQEVSTLVAHPELRDGLHVDKEGNIYVASGGFSGFEIGKYDIQSGQFDPLFAEGFFGPVDVDIYQDSLLIVSNYDNNSLAAYHLETGEIKLLTTALDGPSGIAIDAADNIFVASWGGAPAYVGRQIHRIDANGQVSKYVDSPLLYRPQAMTVNQDQELIVHSLNKLYKVNPLDSTLQLWVNIGVGVGHLIFRERDSCIYGAANGVHKVVKIDREGEVSVLAGSVKGYRDGPIDDALFNTPLGIELSPDESKLYLCESAYGEPIGRLRSIELEQTVWVKEISKVSTKVYPNPSSDWLQVDQGSARSVRLTLFDATGRALLSKKENQALIELDLTLLTSGIYFLELQYPEGTISHRIVRE